MFWTSIQSALLSTWDVGMAKSNGVPASMNCPHRQHTAAPASTVRFTCSRSRRCSRAIPPFQPSLAVGAEAANVLADEPPLLCSP